MGLIVLQVIATGNRLVYRFSKLASLGVTHSSGYRFQRGTGFFLLKVIDFQLVLGKQAKPQPDKARRKWVSGARTPEVGLWGCAGFSSSTSPSLSFAIVNFAFAEMWKSVLRTCIFRSCAFVARNAQVEC